MYIGLWMCSVVILRQLQRAITTIYFYPVLFSILKSIHKAILQNSVQSINYRTLKTKSHFLWKQHAGQNLVIHYIITKIHSFIIESINHIFDMNKTSGNFLYSDSSWYWYFVCQLYYLTISIMASLNSIVLCSTTCVY